MAGVNIIIGLLKVVGDKIPEFAETAAKMIIEWTKAFSLHAPEMLKAATEALINLINGLADVLKENSQPLIQAVLNLTGAILQTIVIALGEILKVLLGWIPGVEKHIDEGMTKVNTIIEERFNPEDLHAKSSAGMDGFNKGISDKTEGAKVAAGDVVDGVIGKFDIMDAFSPGDKGGQDFVDGIAQHTQGANTAGQGVSDAGIEGMFNVDGTQPGAKVSEDFYQTIINNTQNGANAGQTVSDASVEALGNVDATKPGAQITEDFGIGISSVSYKPEGSASSVASNADSNLTADTYTSGSWFTQGFANGINDPNAGFAVTGAASALGQLAASTLNSSIDAHSPSWVARTSGGWFGEGFAIGIRNMANMVKDSAASIGLTAISEIYNAAGEVDKISFKMMDNFETNPVIKPKLDMSDVDMSEFSRVIRPFVSPKDPTGNAGVPKPQGPAPVFNLTMQANNDLPRSTIFRMAGDFQDAMQEIADTEKFNFGGYA